MPAFHHGEVEIAYLDEGQGEPILLIHGFASSKEVNWVRPGWVETFTAAGRRAIALDNRGHGASSKLYDPDSYRTELMAEDAVALLDHLHIEYADLMGYSMGARIAAFAAFAHRDRVRSAVLGGLGYHLIDSAGLPTTIADALEAPTKDHVTDPRGLMFRAFAEQTRSDLRALAACIRGSRQSMTREQLAATRAPMLIALGTRDDIAGSAHDLAEAASNATVLDIPGRDHMLAVGDRVFKQGVLAFLDQRP